MEYITDFSCSVMCIAFIVLHAIEWLAFFLYEFWFLHAFVMNIPSVGWWQLSSWSRHVCSSVSYITAHQTQLNSEQWRWDALV